MKIRLLAVALVMSCGLLCAAPRIPSARHVVLVVEENHSFDSVITKGGMPYLKSLAEQYSVLTNYYANHHPSIGNYFTMTTGQFISLDDHFKGSFAGESIASQLAAAHKSWKLYADSLPRQGYVGSNRRPYVKKHVPMAYFDSVRDDDSQRMNIVPAEQFATDLQTDALPDFSMIIPDMDHDAHDGTLKEADDWLKVTIAPLLASPDFQKDGLLIVTFDESFKNEPEYGGGHVTTVVIGPGVKRHFTDGRFYQHQSLLATLEDVLRLPRLQTVENSPAFGDVFNSRLTPAGN
jgi:phosphatidylinositol-3-phosphatase